jgi:hypothetical protein
MIPVYAVVPSDGRACLQGCLDSLLPQVDLLFLVMNAPFPIMSHPKLIGLPWIGHELNIPAWWNVGLKAAALTARGGSRDEWDVLVTNDDIIAPSGLVSALSAGLRSGGVDAADPWRDPAWRGSSVRPGQADLAYPYMTGRGGHITGECFMLRGESGIMGDERMRWWYCDNDIEYQASGMGGVAIVHDCLVEHLHHGERDGDKVERIALDRAVFAEKWSPAW